MPNALPGHAKDAHEMNQAAMKGRTSLRRAVPVPAGGCLLGLLLSLFVLSPGPSWAQSAQEQDKAEQAQPINPEEGVDLRPRFKEGQSSRYRSWTNQTVSTQVDFRGQSRQFTVQLETEGEYRWRVDRVNADGSAECTAVIEYMTYTQTMRGGPGGERQSTADSRGGGDPGPMQEMVEALADAPVRFTISAEGRIDSMQGVDRIKGGLPEQLRDSLTGKSFRELGQSLALLPGGPASLKVGQGWQVEHDWERQGGNLTLQARYELAGLEWIAGIPVANISVRSQRYDIEPALDRYPPQMRSMISVEQSTGEYQGQIMYDLQRREAVGRNMVERLQVRMRIQPPNMPSAQVVQTDTESQTQWLRITEEE